MINIKNITKLAVIGIMVAPAAFAQGYPNVVHDNNGNITRNTFENCVVSNFTSANDECAGELPKPNLRYLSKEWRNVYFDFNRSTLNVREKAKLDELSRIIADSQEVESVDLTGYADKVGNTAYNKRLSMKRAQTVRSYLSTKGLKTRNVSVEAMGEAQSTKDCGYVEGTKATAEQIACLAEDRRVEIILNFIK